MIKKFLIFTTLALMVLVTWMLWNMSQFTSKQINVLPIDHISLYHFDKNQNILDSTDIPSINLNKNISIQNLSEAIKNTGKLARLIKNNKKTLITYCAYGERSALALSILDKAGFKDSFHLGGGINSWIHNGGAVSKSGD